MMEMKRIVKLTVKDALRYVKEKELEMVRIFEEMLTLSVAAGALRIREEDIELTAHHIVVQGQMWAFRRWALSKQYSIETYIKHQQNHLLKGLMMDC